MRRVFSKFIPVKTTFRVSALVLLNLFLFGWQAFAQTGGTTTYKFLSLNSSARSAALGGNFAAIADNDPGLALSNPSLINEAINKSLTFNYIDHFAGSKFGSAGYGFHIPKAGSFLTSMQFSSYGRTDETNESGEVTGEFTAGDYALNIGWGRSLDTVFHIGANLKMIYSNLAEYNSFGVAVDVAGSYVPNESFAASLLFRNVGRQLKTYSGGDPEPLPFEIQAGISKKLAHLPFRYSVLLQHLETWDLRFPDPNANIDPVTGEAVKEKGLDVFADNLFRHVIIGGEFTPAKFLSIRLGYNYLKRKEVLIDSKPGLVGFSWGLGIRVSKFNFSYARAAYHIVGSPNYISITTNLGDWRK
jgi:hypothetical protein